VSLFADRIDFLEDTAINFLIVLALDWSARYRARMGMVLAVTAAVAALDVILQI
jgi:Co/Zn/Cd efflux system component